MDQEQPRGRVSRIIRDLVPEWRPSRNHVLWAIRILLALVALLGILILIGLPFDITLWNWLDLLIIPVVLAIGGYLFTRSENRATQAAAERRAQDEALQAYLDQMSSMLIPNQDQPSLYKARPGDSLSSVARARTLTVLTRLESVRKGSVVRFLYESGLITKDRTIVDLEGADLRGADLCEANLRDAHFSFVDLSGANLSKASLFGADLFNANLSGANLIGTHLGGAVLVGTDLSQVLSNGATFLGSADLNGANLSGINLSGANLNEAKLRGSDLSGADLSRARGIAREHLAQAVSLAGATMPDGQKYEEWIKDKESGGENEENE